MNIQCDVCAGSFEKEFLRIAHLVTVCEGCVKYSAQTNMIAFEEMMPRRIYTQGYYDAWLRKSKSYV